MLKSRLLCFGLLFGCHALTASERTEVEITGVEQGAATSDMVEMLKNSQAYQNLLSTPSTSEDLVLSNDFSVLRSDPIVAATETATGGELVIPSEYIPEGAIIGDVSKGIPATPEIKAKLDSIQATSLDLVAFENIQPAITIGSRLANTHPISKYVSEDNFVNVQQEVAKIDLVEAQEALQQGLVDEQVVKDAYERHVFPVRPKVLKAGEAPSRHVKLTEDAGRALSGGSFVVVGTDEFSKEWLRLNINTIRSQAKIMILTAVESRQELTAFAKEFNGFMIQPVNADGMAKELGISYYPVLVTPLGAFQ